MAFLHYGFSNEEPRQMNDQNFLDTGYIEKVALLYGFLDVAWGRSSCRSSLSKFRIWMVFRLCEFWDVWLSVDAGQNFLYIDHIYMASLPYDLGGGSSVHLMRESF